MSEKLRGDFTHSEKKEAGSVIADEFSVQAGDIAIRECWLGHDEVYSDGLTIAIPGRVCAIAAPFGLLSAPLSPLKIREERNADGLSFGSVHVRRDRTMVNLVED